MTVLADATEFFTVALQDPYPLYDRMRDEAGVQRIGDSSFYAVCGWDAVMQAVNRVDDFFLQPHRDDGVSRRRRHTVRYGGLSAGLRMHWPPQTTRCTTPTASCLCRTWPPSEYA